MGADARVAIFSQGNPPNKVSATFIFDELTPFIQQYFTLALADEVAFASV